VLARLLPGDHHSNLVALQSAFRSVAKNCGDPAKQVLNLAQPIGSAEPRSFVCKYETASGSDDFSSGQVSTFAYRDLVVDFRKNLGGRCLRVKVFFR
jgi:hypothetical protein